MPALPLLIVATPSPFARKVRVAMLEKGVAFDVEVDNPWNPGSQAARHNPLGRLIKPEEVANAVLWMCRDESAAMTGQCIAVDGGET